MRSEAAPAERRWRAEIRWREAAPEDRVEDRLRVPEERARQAEDHNREDHNREDHSRAAQDR